MLYLGAYRTLQVSWLITQDPCLPVHPHNLAIMNANS